MYKKTKTNKKVQNISPQYNIAAKRCETTDDMGGEISIALHAWTKEIQAGGTDPFALGTMQCQYLVGAGHQHSGICVSGQIRLIFKYQYASITCFAFCKSEMAVKFWQIPRHHRASLY